MRKAMIKNHSYQSYVFPCALCHSIYFLACPPIWWLLCSLSSSSPCLHVCLSAGLLGQRKVDPLHACCGNRNTHAKRAHAAEIMAECLRHPVSINGHMETCERKKMENERFSFSSLECFTCPLRVCLLSHSNCLSVKALVLTLSSPLSLAELPGWRVVMAPQGPTRMS